MVLSISKFTNSKFNRLTNLDPKMAELKRATRAVVPVNFPLVPNPSPNRLLAIEFLPPTMTAETIKIDIIPVERILVVFQSNTDASFHLGDRNENGVKFWEREIGSHAQPLWISIYDASTPWFECDLERKSNSTTKFT